MGGVFSWLFGSREEKKDPISGPWPRIKNMFVNNFRGLLGVLVPLIFIAWRTTRGKTSLEFLWMTMFWFFLVQPINVPCTALMPVFFLPMTGLVPSGDTCKCYFNEGIALFVLSSMAILLLNNSGFDRRIILKILCSGDISSFSTRKLLTKCSIAAFLLSMFSNRLIVTTIITQYVSPIFLKMKGTGAEPDYNKVGYVINNAIQTSSAIGGIGIMHSAYCTHAFRTIFIESCTTGGGYPDLFNYFQYSLFAVPVAVVMFLANYIYHVILLKSVAEKAMTDVSMGSVRTQLLKHKDVIPKNITTHEKISVVFAIALLILLFTRSNRFTPGWAAYNAKEGRPMIKDCTMMAIFVLLLHSLPNGFGFLKIFTAEKKSDLELKPQSGILFWRFVNMHVNWAYMLLIGSGVAIDKAARKTKLHLDIMQYSGAAIVDLNFRAGLFLVCLVSSIITNAMTGVAMVVVVLPYVLCMASEGAADPWPRNVYLAALGVGISGSLGFMWPFLHTPAYICHNVGKVPAKKMAKYSVVSVFVCCIILWVALIIYAPVIWDETGKGFPCEAEKPKTEAPPPEG